MIPYLFLVFAPIFIKVLMEACTGVNIDSNKNYKKHFCILVGILIFAMYALRSQYVGSADSSHYYANWEKLSQLDFTNFLSYAATTTMEKGYLFTTWCLSHIFHPGQFSFVFSGLLFAVAIMYFIYNNSSDSLISTEIFICLGLFGFMMQGMRQSIAMSLCLFSIELTKRRKFIPFVLTIIVATFFHQTAIVFIVIYFFYGRILNVKTGFISLVIGMVIFASGDLITSTANDIFDREYTMTVSSGGFVATAIYIIITLIGLLAAVRYADKEKQAEYKYAYELPFFWFLCFFGCIVYIMRYTSAHASQRISFYFMYSQMILLPNSLFIFNEKSRKILKPVIIILCILLNMYRLPREGLLPYTFFWQ